MPPLVPYELLAFLIGLLLGSFLNVCITRIPRGESIASPRSRCPQCRHTIHAYDNIPILSFIFLRGRCRHCKAPIPWRYPLVELALALWFAALVSRIVLPLTPTAIIHTAALATLGFLLVGLFVMDWQIQRLPDAFTLTGILLGFLFTCASAVFLAPGQDQILLPANHIRLTGPGSGAVEGNLFMTGPEAVVFGRILAILGAALLLLAIRALYLRLRGREGMGLGDVKLIALLAAFLGFTHSLLALFLGVLAAAVFAIVLLARRRAALTTRLPFGSFLAAAGLATALFGPQILAWYTSFFR